MGEAKRRRISDPNFGKRVRVNCLFRYLLSLDRKAVSAYVAKHRNDDKFWQTIEDGIVMGEMTDEFEVYLNKKTGLKELRKKGDK